VSYRQAVYDEPYIKDYHSGSTYRIPGTIDADRLGLPDELKREELNLPDVAEYDVVRHFTRLSQMNYGVDVGFYPLGSCTMKFNPKYADQIASISQFNDSHPLLPEDMVQGNLQVIYELQEALKVLSDMDAVTVQPMAGAQGEFTGMLITRKYFEFRNEPERKEIIIPDSAHGTNPASAAMAGFEVVEVPSSSEGTVDLDALKAAVSERTAAFMITNPNTLGIFETHIEEIAKIVHGAGGLLYYDGANFNAIVGKTSPGLMGFDIVHFNLHKTFATPHGGGGPGSGPVAVTSKLKDFLPVPVVRYDGGRYYLDYSLPHTIGKVVSTIGSFGVLLRAWAYINYNGADGLDENSTLAVLNTNYLRSKVDGKYYIPYRKLKKHEFVISTENTGKRALDVAKFLLDHGMHPPTIYFPLMVKESLMIEPTESVGKSDLDKYAQLLLDALDVPDSELKELPKNTTVTRIDEVKAARDLKLRW
jgi:glycine dehydrogenase subunit 2